MPFMIVIFKENFMTIIFKDVYSASIHFAFLYLWMLYINKISISTDRKVNLVSTTASLKVKDYFAKLWKSSRTSVHVTDANVSSKHKWEYYLLSIVQKTFFWKINCCSVIINCYRACVTRRHKFAVIVKLFFSFYVA